MKIRGAVLEAIGRQRPYSVSRPIRVSTLDIENPRAGEVLVRVEVAGLCHSDLSVVDGNRVRPVPMLLGHEAAGIVEVVGEGVTDLAAGQRVVMTFLPRCGGCRGCATGGRLPCEPGSAANTRGELLSGGSRLRRDGETVKHHLGVSAFATHAVVDRRSLIAIDDDVPPSVAALLGCAVLTGGGAVVNEGAPQPGEAVTVVGLGGVGMAALLTAVALGRGAVIGVDPMEAKRELALELGASAVYTPAEALAVGITAEVVIEAAGSTSAFETAVELTAPGGRTIAVGLPAPDATAIVRTLGLVSEGRRIVGSYLGSAVPERDIPLFVELWRSGRLPIERLVTAEIDLEDINEGMDALAEGVAVRQMVRMDGLPQAVRPA